MVHTIRSKNKFFYFANGSKPLDREMALHGRVALEKGVTVPSKLLSWRSEAIKCFAILL